MTSGTYGVSRCMTHVIDYTRSKSEVSLGTRSVLMHEIKKKILTGTYLSTDRHTGISKHFHIPATGINEH